MKDFQLIYLDFFLNNSFFLEIFEHELDCVGIIASDLFREQLSLENDLTNEIRRHLDNGELIPNRLSEKIVTKKAREIFDSRILLIGYPGTIEQLRSLKIALLNENISISKFWYIKHHDFAYFKEKKIREVETNKWFEKFGSDMEETWTEKFLNTRKEITVLLESGLVLDKKIIELSYEESIDRNLIKSKIKIATNRTFD